MNLRDMVDELRRNILRDTSTAVTAPTEGQVLWDNTTLVRYIDEAYFKFARETWCLRDDSTAAITQITLEVGVDSYALDPRVLSVTSVRRSDGKPLTRSKNPSLFFDAPNSARATTGTLPWVAGEPLLYATDLATKRLMIRNVPSSDYDGEVLYLRVSRKPLEHLTEEDLDAEPEVDEDFHMDLLEWAAYRAYRNHDTDGENFIKADRHRTQYERAVAKAKADIQRLMFEPVEFEPNSYWE